MGKSTDVRVVAAALYFLEIKNRIPLKFGPETTTELTCARARRQGGCAGPAFLCAGTAHSPAGAHPRA